MRRWPLAPFAVYLGAFFISLAAVLLLNRGHFCYSLDDPYIHLALADNVFHGAYGLRPGIFSAPSSSILWPFLLTFFSFAPGFLWVPLFLNLFFSLGSLAVFIFVCRDGLSPLPEDKRRWIPPWAAIFFIPAANLIGATFSGMEHSLQIFISLLVLRGLLREEADFPAGWLGPMVVLGPLIRYENLALSVPVIMLLVYRGQIRRASLWGALLIAALALFSVFLQSNGIGWLPSSILWKSAPFVGNGFWAGLLSNLNHNIFSPRGAIFLAALALLLYRLRRETWGSSFCVAGAVILHLIFGAMGRYDHYLFAVLLTMLISQNRNRRRFAKKSVSPYW